MSFLSGAAHSISQNRNQTLLNTNTIEINNNTNNTSNNSATSSSLTMVDAGDTNYEIKTEFYTREGVWKQIPNGEYIKQSQQQQQQQQHTMSPQYQQMHGNMNGSGANINNQQSSVGQASSSSLNDSVKIGVFKYSKRSIFKKKRSGSTTTKTRRKSFRTKLKCSNCQREQSDDDEDEEGDYMNNNNNNNNSQENSEYDDDDDVIFTKVKSSFESDYDEEDEDSSENDDEYEDEDESSSDAVFSLTCKYCKQFLRKKQDDTNDKRLLSKTFASENLKSLDLMLFNYAREIYFYEFNPVIVKVSGSFCFGLK
jgi:hypothetical protein